MGFKTLAIQKHSGEVWKVLGAVKTEFDKFGSVLAQTQQRINQANAELDKLVGARTRSIQKKLRGISRLDKDIAEDLLGVSDECYPESLELFEESQEDDDDKDKLGGVL
jgi:DNA recombination protein RmuC